jgi:hypothetical protein
MEESKIKRALTVDNVLNKKRKLLDFESPWVDCIGKPELRGSWIIWGESGSGKTTFTMSLAKYLTKFGKVAYNSMEEGDSESIKLVLQRVRMKEVQRSFLLLDNESIDELKKRLRKQKAPRVVIVDSIQYSSLTFAEYKQLKEEFPNTLFIFLSHQEGKLPEGKVAKKVRYDAYVKIRVEGYRAFFVSRYGGKSTYDVWPEEAEKYHGLNNL